MILCFLFSTDIGGSNGYKPRRWKKLQQINNAGAFGLSVTDTLPKWRFQRLID
jgi:hypothetical protein